VRFLPTLNWASAGNGTLVVNIGSLSDAIAPQHRGGPPSSPRSSGPHGHSQDACSREVEKFFRRTWRADSAETAADGTGTEPTGRDEIGSSRDGESSVFLAPTDATPRGGSSGAHSTLHGVF